MKKGRKGSGDDASKTGREKQLEKFLGETRRETKAPGYYPGAGEYHPSKVLAGRAA